MVVTASSLCAEGRTRGRSSARFIIWSSKRLLGRVLRATSLDDIGPQCWNIVVGDMAVFGPRPFLVTERHLIGLRDQVVLHSTPGLISYYGAYGRARLTVEQRVRLDARFAKGMHNLGVKWRALVGTVYHCLMRTGAG